jgi:septal ring factor EnvC (AmiA/AmiB activator)
MRRYTLLVLVLVVAGLLLMGCDQKKYTEQITNLTKSNDSLKTELMNAQNQVAELQGKVTMITTQMDSLKTAAATKVVKKEAKPAGKTAGKAAPAKKEGKPAKVTK